MSHIREIVVHSQLREPIAPPSGYIPEYAPTRNLAVARIIAEITSGALNETGIARPGAFVIPDRPLLRSEAEPLGIQEEGDLFGGVVDVKLHHDKAILHPLVGSDSEKPAYYSRKFSDEARPFVLPGYTVFSSADALKAYTLLRREGLQVRLKDPSAEGGNGQRTVDSLEGMQRILTGISPKEIKEDGLVLEHNILTPDTLSIGQIYMDGSYFSYFGHQHTVLLDGEPTYGGTTLTMHYGTLGELSAQLKDGNVRTAVDQARGVHGAYSHYDPIVSRLNFDVVQGWDVNGVFYSGVVDQSFRIGGASPAEVVAIRELQHDPSLKRVTTRVDIQWHPEPALLSSDKIIFFDHPTRRDEVGILERA